MKFLEGNFKRKYTLEERMNESKRIITKYPDRIPVIVEISRGSSKEFPELDRQKYLVPNDLTVGQLSYVIRKRVKLESHKAMFIYCGKIMPASSTSIKTLYNEHKDPDNFIYFSVCGESTFGY